MSSSRPRSGARKRFAMVAIAGLAVRLGEAAVAGSAQTAVRGESLSSLPELCHLANASFHLWDAPSARCKSCKGAGSGSVVPAPSIGECDGVVMQSATGMAASFMTQPFVIEPTVVYNVSYEVRTTGLVATTAYLTGGVYAQFYDRRADFNESTDYNNEKAYGDGWYPGLGDHELENTGTTFVRRTLSFAPPTTSKYTILHLAFAAHTQAYAPDRIHGGSARGKVEIRNVKIVRTGTKQAPPPVQITVPSSSGSKLSAAIEMVNSCFHNSALTGNFTVGSDYVISGNLSPDLGFGILGVRRMGSKHQMSLYTSQFDPSNPDGQIALGADGMVLRQRVQAQTFWPLGIDQAFSHSGNLTYLEEMLPLVDRSLEWCASRYDVDGLFHCNPDPAKGSEGSDCGGPGMDWVDWSTSRASGKTFTFELWHAFALKRIAVSDHLSHYYCQLSANCRQDRGRLFMKSLRLPSETLRQQQFTTLALLRSKVCSGASTGTRITGGQTTQVCSKMRVRPAIALLQSVTYTHGLTFLLSPWL